MKLSFIKLSPLNISNIFNFEYKFYWSRNPDDEEKNIHLLLPSLFFLFLSCLGGAISETRFISSFHTGSGGFYLGIQVAEKEAGEELLMTRPLKSHTFGMYFWQEKHFWIFKESVAISFVQECVITPLAVETHFVSESILYPFATLKAQMTLDAGRLEGRCPHIPTLPHTMGGVGG